MVESGELDGCYFASSYLAARVPELGVFDQPFQAGSREEVFAGLDGDGGAALAERWRPQPLSRAGLVGQRHPPHQQRHPTDPHAGGLCRPASAHARQCAAPGGVPPARFPADVHRCRRSAARGGRPDRRCAGEPAHQPGEFRSARAPQARQPDRASARHRLLLVNRARYDALPDEPRRMLDAAARESEAVNARSRSRRTPSVSGCLPKPASRSSGPMRSTFTRSAPPWPHKLDRQFELSAPPASFCPERYHPRASVWPV